jgi:hypothetical protein
MAMRTRLEAQIHAAAAATELYKKLKGSSRGGDDDF